jgi:hypothetical protein
MTKKIFLIVIAISIIASASLESHANVHKDHHLPEEQHELKIEIVCPASVFQRTPPTLCLG